MKLLVVLLCVAYTFASLEEDRERWVNFKTQHGKTYKNLQEEKLRFSIFQENVRFIEDHNKQFAAGNTTYTMGINHFADRSKEELLAMSRTQKLSRPELEIKSIYKPKGLQVPASLDWRNYGAVSPIKDQMQCGSCWAFSTVGSLEGFNAIKTGQMTTLSEQQLVDCCPHGCDGNMFSTGYDYVQQYGIQSEDSYTYNGVENQCRYDANRVAARINGWAQTESGNENALLEVVGTQGPVTVSMICTNLYFYSGGIFSDPNASPEGESHGVVAIGYGHDDQTGLDYWIMKNSWTTNWGEQGFFRMKRGSNDCFMAADDVYPIM